MGKFNPEDFKAPVMKPLSTITVNNENVEWDLAKNGLVVPHAKGWIILMDRQTKALYEETSGFWFALKIKNGNIESNVESVRGDKKSPLGELDYVVPVKKLEIPRGNFYKECSCVPCGVPMTFNKISGEVYAKVTRKGTTTENITGDELRRIFRLDSNHIDGVVYDNESTCTDCKEY
jgi:hypothetical protein